MIFTLLINIILLPINIVLLPIRLILKILLFKKMGLWIKV